MTEYEATLNKEGSKSLIEPFDQVLLIIFLQFM